MRKSDWAKISAAFDPFLREAPAEAVREAIVIYDRPPRRRRKARVGLTSRTAQLERRKELISEHTSLETRLRDVYHMAGLHVIGRRQLSEESFRFHGALGMATVQIDRKMLPELAAQEHVVAIMPNQRLHAIEPFKVDYVKLSRAEKKRGLTWGLNYLEIEELWKITRGGGVTVAVLDTGVHPNHPDLADRVSKFILIDRLGIRIDAKPGFDAGQHGTHVCGTIAGSDSSGVAIGVAPEVDLLVAAVLVGEPTLRTLIEGMSWAVEKGADIINLSLGFTYYEPNFAWVIGRLVGDYGVLPVVAVGNEKHGNSSCPGNTADAFGVGALEKMTNTRYQVASFSSGASLIFPGDEPPQVNKPDVVAPGVQVWSAIPPEEQPEGTYWHAYFDGTSMAAPHVSGVAALLMAAEPTATASEIMGVLRETAEHPGGKAACPDNRYGWGAVRPLAALDALRSR